MKRIFPVAVLGALIAGCGSSGGGGGGTLPPSASLDLVPTAEQPAVVAAKKTGVNSSDIYGALFAEGTHNGDTANVITSVEIDGTSYVGGVGSEDFTSLPVGMWSAPVKITYDMSSVGDAFSETGREATGTLWAYNQPYSVVMGTTISADDGHLVADGGTGSGLNFFNAPLVYGRDTTAAEVVTLKSNNVTATYTGVAFDHLEQGTLSYTVDFFAGKGSGTISGINRTGLIMLQEAVVGVGAFSAQGISGNAAMSSGTGGYQLGFYGPNAEEIAGYVSGPVMGDIMVNFGGSR